MIASMSFSGIYGGFQNGKGHCIEHVTGDGINGSALCDICLSEVIQSHQSGDTSH